MVEPKLFYRKFDELLKTIRQKKTSKNFICLILTELQSNFGEELHLGGLRVYEERSGEFVLVRPSSNQNGKNGKVKIPRDSAVIQRVVEHGSYIYDDTNFSIDPEISKQTHYAIPAAIVIRSPEQRWIGVFELTDGWVRDEVLFSLNAVRTAINYRLFSEAMRTELEQAAQIQRSLLPTKNPQIPGYQIAARAQQTEIVGGDLYDYFEFDSEIFGVCIGDASGHGIPAALLVRDVVIGLRMGLAKHMKMAHTFHKLNEVIYRSTYSSRFVSLFYGEIERDGHLIFVNAGHPAPFLVHGDEVTDLQATGLILGALPDITLHRSFARLQPNSVLFLHTDGLFEREDENEEIYSINKLKELVKKHQEKSAEEILNLIFEDVDRYGNHAKWEDDSTLVVIKRIEE